MLFKSSSDAGTIILMAIGLMLLAIVALAALVF